MTDVLSSFKITNNLICVANTQIEVRLYVMLKFISRWLCLNSKRMKGPLEMTVEDTIVAYFKTLSGIRLEDQTKSAIKSSHCKLHCCQNYSPKCK